MSRFYVKLFQEDILVCTLGLSNIQQVKFWLVHIYNSNHWWHTHFYGAIQMQCGDKNSISSGFQQYLKLAYIFFLSTAPN